MQGAHPIALLLRHPEEVARRCLDERGLRPLATASIAVLLVGGAVFGGVVGSFRGDAQILYSAIKLPLAQFGALVICVPAFHALAACLGRPWSMRTTVALTNAAAGRAALVLLAFAPVLWLGIDLGLGYHASALATTIAYGASGLAALGVLLRGLGEGARRGVTAAAFVAIFLAASAQTGWILRPFLGRPSQDSVPLLREVEGGFSDALFTSARSAMGRYDRDGER